jgi:hypothetical protein
LAYMFRRAKFGQHDCHGCPGSGIDGITHEGPREIGS